MNTRLVAALCLLALAGCADTHLVSRPGVYDVTTDHLAGAKRPIPVVLVHPAHDLHPGYLLVYTTGDDGWSGTSAALFKHLADQGYTCAGFSAPEILDPIVHEGKRVHTRDAAHALEDMYALARSRLGLAADTAVLVVGFSRGATSVAYTAIHPELQKDFAGGVAIALTREADYLRVPEKQRGPAIQVDAEGRLQMYPAVKLLASKRLAVIQATGDGYVRAAESRELLGPDTPTLRLYTVDSRFHGFQDARDKLMADLDDALRWVESAPPPS